MQPKNTKVYVEHGGADEVWDVGLNTQQLGYAEVDSEFTRGFSMHLDMESGKVSLNRGYEPGSTPDRHEQSMFEEFRDSAIQGLLDNVGDDVRYTAFKIMAQKEAEGRAERLETLSERLDEFENED